MSNVDILKKRLAEWKHCLNASDVHSIGMQIADMLWRSAFYRSVNESRHFLPDAKNRRKQANEPLHEFIDNCYFIANSSAIRRLLDKSSPMSGPRGVYSLHGLIGDIRKNVKLITRANVLESRGLEYDYEPIKQRAFAEAKSPFISRDGWLEASHWHVLMDRLCGVTAQNRNTGDTPDPNKLDRLLKELEEGGSNVQDWVDKFVAHAASPESRQKLNPEHQSMSLAKLWRAERVAVRAANFIAHFFVDGMNIGGVPVPQDDPPFLHLDEPFIQPFALPAMQKAWDQHCKEISSCKNWFWDSPLVDKSDVWEDEDR